MKKNAMLKIAAVVLVAVLLTTCAISSTFAKYVSNANTNTNEARVAKWGVTATLTAPGENGLELFQNNHGDVVGDSGAIVVAPGTQNTMSLGANVTGNPEVTCKVTVSAKIVAQGFIDGYRPVKVSIGGVELGDEFYSDNFVEITAFSSTYDPATTSPEFRDYTNLNISYVWDFEAAGADKTANDANDTALGDAAARNDAATIQIFVKIDVVQTNNP